MEATVITLAFDRKRGGFPAEELEDFCLNKKVHQIEAQFFTQEGTQYWSMFIRFERVVAYHDGVKDLNPLETQAYEALAKWRKEKADAGHHPTYIIANNRHLVVMIKRRVRSKAGFDGIKGFGRKRIANYGEEIIAILKKFFPDEPTSRLSRVRTVVPDPQLDPGPRGQDA